MNIYHPTALGMPDPNRGAQPIKVINAPGSVVLTVPDHLMVLEMIP
jgi:hypothetical protein